MILSLLLACSSSKDIEPTEEDSSQSLNCVNIDIGSAVGEGIQTGTISSGTGRYGYCGVREISIGHGLDDSGSHSQWGGIETILSWTAPSTGIYSIYTLGSEYDTTLSVKRSCRGEAIDCDDDGGLRLDSMIRLSAEGGQTYLIILDAYSSAEEGRWVLNIVEGEVADWSDSGWMDSGEREDTGSKGRHINHSFGCEIMEWGVCYEQASNEGWGYTSAIQACHDLSSQYNVNTSFYEDTGCTRTQYIGECQIAESSHMPFPAVTLYSKKQWAIQEVEYSCAQAKGLYIRH